MYAPEILACSLLPMLAGAYAARDFGFEPWSVVILVAALYHVPEALVNRALRWPTNLFSPFNYLLRDLLFPVIWIDGWLGDDFVWLGNSMSVREEADETVDGAA
jgi:ceramide glucosyltransferase